MKILVSYSLLMAMYIELHIVKHPSSESAKTRLSKGMYATIIQRQILMGKIGTFDNTV